MLKVLISASPENFSEPFVKMVKEAGLPVKLKVWSRDDHAKQGYDMYFLTQRDFVYLDKLHQLPPANKVMAIFSPSYKESFLIEETDVRFSGFIMGEVEERASRSVELLKIYFQHEQMGQDSINLETLSLSPWLQQRVESVLSDMKEVSSDAKVKIFKNDQFLGLKFENCSFKFAAEDFKFGFNSNLISKNSKISGIVLNRIFENASTFVQIEQGLGRNGQILIQFRLLKSMKQYENFPKLFAILPHYEQGFL